MKFSVIIPFVFALSAHAVAPDCSLPLSLEAMHQRLGDLRTGTVEMQKQIVDRREFLDMMRGSVYLANPPRLKTVEARIEALEAELNSLTAAYPNLDWDRAYAALAEFSDLGPELIKAMSVEYVPDDNLPHGKRSRESLGRLGDEFGDDLLY